MHYLLHSLNHTSINRDAPWINPLSLSSTMRKFTNSTGAPDCPESNDATSTNSINACKQKAYALEPQLITDPNQMQRAQFIANTLVNALFDDDEQKIAATSAYLGTRVADLKQVKAKHSEKGMVIELVFDRDYDQAASEQPIQFEPGRKKDA